MMFINLILICIVGLIVYTNGDLNDTRCGPRQNFAEDAKAFVNGNGTGFSYGDGGLAAAASARNLPAVIGHNIAMTVVYLKPCDLNLPHIHPSENTGQFHALTLNEGQGTAFGPGALHFEQNIGCDDAVLVAAFNNEDPGTAQITEAIKALPLDVLTTAFAIGSSSSNEIDKVRQNFPKTPALGIDSCYKTCNITQNGK